MIKGGRDKLVEQGRERNAESADARTPTFAFGFCTEHSAKARGVGFQWEIAPTLRGGVTPAIGYGLCNDD